MSIIEEVAEIRRNFADAYITNHINARHGNVTTEEIEGWLDEAYVKFRELYPNVNDLLL